MLTSNPVASAELLSPAAEESQAMDVLDGRSLTIVGDGRMGNALAMAFGKVGVPVSGPLRRNQPIGGNLVLLAVPDREIAGAVAGVPAGAIVGHTAGAMSFEPLLPREAFSFHPLMTAVNGRAEFAG